MVASWSAVLPESCPQSRADGAHFPSRSVVCRREPAQARARARAGRGRQAGWLERGARRGRRPDSELASGRLLTASTCGLRLGRWAPPTAPHPRLPPASGPRFQLVRSSCERSSRPGPQRQATSRHPPLHPDFCHSGAGIHSFPVSLCPVPPSVPSPTPSPIPYPATPSLLCPSPLVPAPVPLASALHTPWTISTPCSPRAIGTLCTPLSPSAPSHRPPGLSLAGGSLLPSRVVGCASGSRLVMSGWRSGSTSGSRPPPTRASSR